MKPWDIGRLTVAEFELFVAQAEQWQADAQQVRE